MTKAKREITGDTARVDIFLRCTPDFRERVRQAAATEGKTVSLYIQEAVETKLGEDS